VKNRDKIGNHFSHTMDSEWGDGEGNTAPRAGFGLRNPEPSDRRRGKALPWGEGKPAAYCLTFDSPDRDRIAPYGITFAQFFSTTPQTGTTDYPAAFAGAGTVIAVGDTEDRH
jgi:hypothetical protein